MRKKTILITGCSTGIGRVTAKYFQQKGWNVAATVRKYSSEDAELRSLDNVLVEELDVTKSDTIKSAVAATINRFGTIDVLVNNAGYGAYGVLEATPESAIRHQFDVNVIGLLNVTKAVLPYMRKASSGTIVNISSIAGKTTMPFGALYHGSKFAVEGLSEALSYELGAIGVKIKIVEPGMINTNFEETTLKGFKVDHDQKEYQPFIEKFMAGIQNMTSQSSEPILVAKIIYEAATDGTNKLRYTAGPDAEQLIAARKQMNDVEFIGLMKKQLGLTYA